MIMSEKYKFRSTRKSCSQKSEANHQKPISKSQKRAEIIQSEEADQIMKKKSIRIQRYEQIRKVDGSIRRKLKI